MIHTLIEVALVSGLSGGIGATLTLLILAVHNAHKAVEHSLIKQRHDLLRALSNLLTEEQLDAPLPSLDGKTARTLLTEIRSTL